MPSDTGTYSLPRTMMQKKKKAYISASKVIRQFMLGFEEGATTIHIHVRDVIKKPKEGELLGNGRDS